MDRQRMNQRAMDIIREEKSKGEVISTGDVLDNVISVLDSVTLDRRYMKHCMEETAAMTSGKSLLNMLNMILKLFGLRAVRTDMNIQFKNDASRGKLDSMLMLNEGVYMTAISNMASSLAGYEREYRKKDEIIKDWDAMLKDQERKMEQMKQMKEAADAQFRLVADWIQNVLVTFGKGESDNPLFRQLQKLMDELDIEAYWSTEGTALQGTSMFSEMWVEDIGKFREKPCLMCKGEVIVKGVKYRVVEKAVAEALSET